MITIVDSTNTDRNLLKMYLDYVSLSFKADSNSFMGGWGCGFKPSNRMLTITMTCSSFRLWTFPSLFGVFLQLKTTSCELTLRWITAPRRLNLKILDVPRKLCFAKKERKFSCPINSLLVNVMQSTHVLSLMFYSLQVNFKVLVSILKFGLTKKTSQYALFKSLEEVIWWKLAVCLYMLGWVKFVSLPNHDTTVRVSVEFCPYPFTLVLY